MSENSQTLIDYNWGRRSEAVYKVRLSVLYHLKRQRFFNQVDKWVTIITALSATSAAASLIASSETVGQVASAVTALLSLVPLVFAPGSLAKHHGELAAEFRKLRAEFERAGEHWSSSVCDEMSARLIEIEAGESDPLCALVAHCQNQLNLSTGGPSTHLTWWQRTLMHVVSFDANSLSAQKPKSDKV